MLGQLNYQRNNHLYVFCSEGCSNWFNMDFAHNMLFAKTAQILSGAKG